MLMVGGTARVEGRFTVDGVLTDPDAITLRIKNPAGTITTPAPVQVSTGVYEYVQDLDQDGLWAWEMIGTGTAAGAFGDTFTVVPSIIDGPGNRAHLVSTGDVETALQRQMTVVEADRAEQLIPQVVALLERTLNRTLVAREFADERHVIAQDGVLYPFHGPVQSVSGIRFGEVTNDTTTVFNDDWAEARFSPGTVIYVTYTAGPSEPDPQVQGVVIDAVAGAILAGAAVATGAIKSYSVEGTSISYGSGVSGDGAAGRVTVADLSGLSGLKRLVWR